MAKVGQDGQIEARKELAIGRIAGHELIVALTVDKANSVGTVIVQTTIEKTLFERRKSDLTGAAMPTNLERRGAAIAATVAMLRAIERTAMRTRVDERRKGAGFFSFTFDLTSGVERVERRAKLEEMAQ